MTREEAIAIFNDNNTILDNPNYLSTEIGEAWDMAIEALKADQPRGEAIYKVFDEETGVSNSYWCTCCGFPIVQVYMSFCGNCGAKLK